MLIVAYYFPPIGGIGSIRLARFAKLLPERGWQTTVLAPRNTPHALDPHLHFPEDRVVRSRSLELSRLGAGALGVRSGDGAAGDNAPQGRRGALRSLAHRYLFFPDAQVGWYPGAVAAGLAALRRERFDAIYSSANPVTAHLVARTLSRRARLPWIAEYRDPWSDRLDRDHPYARAARGLERAIAREATTVVMPTPTWAAHYGALWDTRIAVVPNGHDGRLPERVRPDRPTLTYVGTYYPGDQDLSTLWRALARLRERDGGNVPRIRFVGRLPDPLRHEIAELGLGDLLEATGFLPHDEAMRELMSSSMLVASGVAGEHPSRRGWVPAKLFDYLASGLPVLLMAEPESDAAALVTGQPGCHVVRPGHVEGVVAALREGLASEEHERDVRSLSSEARADALAQVLDRAARATARPGG